MSASNSIILEEVNVDVNHEKKAKDDIETDKPPLELPYLFEKEIYRKQNKKIYILTEYIPTERVIPIVGKFYSKHDVKNIRDFNKKIMHYTKLIDNLQRKPSEKYDFPKLESQEYGWIESNLSKSKQMKIATFNRIQAPKIRCHLTIYGEKLNSEKHTQRPEFHGKRFYC